MDEKTVIDVVLNAIKAPFAEIKDNLATLTTNFATLTSSLAATDQKLSTGLSAVADQLTQRFVEFGEAIQFASAEIDALRKVHIPAVVKHVAKV